MITYIISSIPQILGSNNTCPWRFPYFYLKSVSIAINYCHPVWGGSAFPKDQNAQLLTLIRRDLVDVYETPQQRAGRVSYVQRRCYRAFIWTPNACLGNNILGDRNGQLDDCGSWKISWLAYPAISWLYLIYEAWSSRIWIQLGLLYQLMPVPVGDRKARWLVHVFLTTLRYSICYVTPEYKQCGSLITNWNDDNSIQQYG